MTGRLRTRVERIRDLRDKYALAMQVKYSPTATEQQKADAAWVLEILNKMRDRLIAEREAWADSR